MTVVTEGICCACGTVRPTSRRQADEDGVVVRKCGHCRTRTPHACVDLDRPTELDRVLDDLAALGVTVHGDCTYEDFGGDRTALAGLVRWYGHDEWTFHLRTDVMEWWRVAVARDALRLLTSSHPVFQLFRTDEGRESWQHTWQQELGGIASTSGWCLDATAEINRAQRAER